LRRTEKLHELSRPKILISAAWSIATLGWIGVAYFAKEITTGAVELTRWNSLVISNKTALFFMVMMTIAGFGGYVSSKFTGKKKTMILAITYSIVFITGYVMSKAVPFRF